MFGVCFGLYIDASSVAMRSSVIFVYMSIFKSICLDFSIFDFSEFRKHVSSYFKFKLRTDMLSIE